MNNDFFDAVYFLMFPGWEKEMRSNRWHFISRWAHHAPVILIQPVQHVPTSEPDSTPEPRIPGARILKIQSVRPSPFFKLSTHRDIQLAQVEQDMRLNHIRRPLLWAYNPTLSDLYTRLPAAYRIFHATEDYFRFGGPEQNFVPQLISSITRSDLIVAVSDGVAESILKHASPRRLSIETNGCDFDFYATSEGGQRPIGLCKLGKRVAIYAGNINGRLDYSLIYKACASLVDTEFAFFGPLADLSTEHLKLWKQLLAKRNFHYMGTATPEQLRSLYAEADLGIIPYLNTPMISESGFPLKALEMGASGLPVVSTLMKPLIGLSDALVVTTTAEQFINATRHVDRQSISAQEKQGLIALAQREGYDEKFRRICMLISEDLAAGTNPAGELGLFEPLNPRIEMLVAQGNRRTQWRIKLYALTISAYRALRGLRSRFRMGSGKVFIPSNLDR